MYYSSGAVPNVAQNNRLDHELPEKTLTTPTATGGKFLDFFTNDKSTTKKQSLTAFDKLGFYFYLNICMFYQSRYRYRDTYTPPPIFFFCWLYFPTTCFSATTAELLCGTTDSQVIKVRLRRAVIYWSSLPYSIRGLYPNVSNFHFGMRTRWRTTWPEAATWKPDIPPGGKHCAPPSRPIMRGWILPFFSRGPSSAELK